MKGLPFSHRHMLFGCGAIFLFGALFLVCHRVFATRTISCSFDSSIAPQAQRDVLDSLQRLKSKSSITPSAIIQELNREFKWIDSVAVRRSPCNVAAVSVAVRHPFCVLNADHILTDAGIVVQKNIYADAALARLHTVYVPDEKLDSVLVADVLRRYLQRMPGRVFEQYEVHCLHDLAVMLRDRSCNRFAVMCNPHESLDNQMLDRCAHIKQQLSERGSLQGKKQWVADVRFSKQIVVSGHMGGVSHGSHTC